MLFSILFTYQNNENQNLVLVCTVMKEQSTRKYFVIHLPPSPSFSTSCLVFAVASRVFVVEQFGKTNLMI